MRKVVYSILICGSMFFLGGCSVELYNSSPAFVPMFTKKTEIAGNAFLAPNHLDANVGLGFLKYFGIYGGGHYYWSSELFSYPGQNSYAYGGILGRHNSHIGNHFILFKEVLIDYGTGQGSFAGGELTGSDYYSNRDKSNYNPLNAQLNLALRWKGLALGVALKNMFLNFNRYQSTYYNYHGGGNLPEKLNSFTQYVLEPNIFFRAGGKSLAVFLNIRWATLPFGASINSYSYLPGGGLSLSTQVSLGLQFNIGLSKE